MSFVKNFSDHFRSYRHDVTEKARQYTCGLMQAGSRKNMDRMEEVVPGSKARNLQQFLTHSKWDARSVIDHVAREVDGLFGDDPQVGLLIDESGFVKQGAMSVGVARQWLGRLGEGRQRPGGCFWGVGQRSFRIAGGCSALSSSKVGRRSRGVAKKAGIPASERTFRTKEQLALEIVQHAVSQGLRFGWVGADAGYGKGPAFCLALDRMGQKFVVDVHTDFRVYLEDPKPYIPDRTGKRGRKNIRYRSDAEPIEVKKIVENFSLCDQPVLKIRKTTRGPLRVRALRVPVYVWDGRSAEAGKWYLIATQTLGKNPKIKISLSNAPESTELATLAWMQLQRFWVERVFEDAKSECGMADYQVRKWSAWHHHMALVMMAMLFMLTLRMQHIDTYPLLSCSDIEELLCRFLPRRNVTRDEVIQQLHHRHRKRKASIDAHARSNKKQKSINQK